MDISTLLKIISEIGLPTVILFWVLFISGQNQRAMLNQMTCIKKEIANLTVTIKEATIYMKSKGGGIVGYPY